MATGIAGCLVSSAEFFDHVPASCLNEGIAERLSASTGGQTALQNYTNSRTTSRCSSKYCGRPLRSGILTLATSMPSCR